MYEDYYSNPTLQNANDDESNVAKKSLNKQSIIDLNDNDKYYYKFKTLFNEIDKDGVFKKYKTLAYYATPSCPGSRIRDAISGKRSSHFVGSLDEDLYFSVLICNGKGRHNEPVLLFYDSPERYEMHQDKILSQSVKEQWAKKFMAAKSKLTNE